jgi:hypothetical protein
MDQRQVDTSALMVAVTSFTAPTAATMLGYVAHYNFGLPREEIRTPAVVAQSSSLRSWHLIFFRKGCASHDHAKLFDGCASIQPG